MNDYKLNPNCGFYQWAAQMSQLNDFIPFMLSNALDKKRVDKALFDEMGLCEILNDELPKIYQEINHYGVEHLQRKLRQNCRQA